MSMLRRRALIGVIAAIFGIGARLALGLSAEAESALAAGQRYLDPFIKQGEALTRGDARRLGAGVAVSEDGDTALISEGGQDAVWVYTRSGSTWTERAKLSAPDNETENNFGEHLALSADGDTALISEPGHPVKSCRAACCGSVALSNSRTSCQIHRKPHVGVRAFGLDLERGGAPRLIRAKRLKQRALAAASHSGDGSTALIGFGGGGVWVFARSGSTWSQEAQLVGSAATTKAFLGPAWRSRQTATRRWSVTQTSAVLAATPRCGFSRARARLGTEHEKLTGSREEFDSFGTSVALSGKGDTALISGYTDGRGSVWVFRRSGSAWTAQESLTHQGRNYGYGLGGGPYLIVRVSGDADTALVVSAGEGKEGQLRCGSSHARVRPGATAKSLPAAEVILAQASRSRRQVTPRWLVNPSNAVENPNASCATASSSRSAPWSRLQLMCVIPRARSKPP